MLKTNLSHYVLSVFVNIYPAPTAILGYLWKWLHNIWSYSGGCMSYQGKSIVCCVSTNKKYVPSFKGLCHLKDHSNTFFNPSLKTNEPYQLKTFLYVSICHENIVRRGEETGFTKWLLDVTLTCQRADNLILGFSLQLNFCYNHEITTAPQMCMSDS